MNGHQLHTSEDRLAHETALSPPIALDRDTIGAIIHFAPITTTINGAGFITPEVKNIPHLKHAVIDLFTTHQAPTTWRPNFTPKRQMDYESCPEMQNYIATCRKHFGNLAEKKPFSTANIKSLLEYSTNYIIGYLFNLLTEEIQKMVNQLRSESSTIANIRSTKDNALLFAEIIQIQGPAIIKEMDPAEILKQYRRAWKESKCTDDGLSHDARALLPDQIKGVLTDSLNPLPFSPNLIEKDIRLDAAESCGVATDFFCGHYTKACNLLGLNVDKRLIACIKNFSDQYPNWIGRPDQVKYIVTLARTVLTNQLAAAIVAKKELSDNDLKDIGFFVMGMIEALDNLPCFFA